MTVYNFYILGKNGQSIFYHEWERPQKASLSRSEEDKLMAGLIFSLSNFARKMTNEPDSGSFQGLKVKRFYDSQSMTLTVSLELSDFEKMLSL